jgi:hypothetical protein
LDRPRSDVMFSNKSMEDAQSSDDDRCHEFKTDMAKGAKAIELMS